MRIWDFLALGTLIGFFIHPIVWVSCLVILLASITVEAQTRANGN